MMRLRWPSVSDGEFPMSNRTSALVWARLACCPPGPPLGPNRHSSSFAGMHTLAVTRSASSEPSTARSLGATLYADRMTGNDWIIAFAAELGLEPLDAAEVEDLLDLAGVAAHASERLAAPLTCYLAARAGITPADALARARAMAGA